MKCKVCGAESGKYPLCRACNTKKEKGTIIKCDKCENWHYANAECPITATKTNDSEYLYEVKKALISNAEKDFYNAIKDSIPEKFFVFPQINLASFIERTDNARFHNELFRNVDFLIADGEYVPKLVIEINDQTHLTKERKERDEKVQKICEEAGIPFVKFWTSYGVNAEYIKGRIDEALNKTSCRVHHFDKKSGSKENQKNGCYVATAIYGSYDCPQVWVLRRYRDNVLSKTCFGKIFIKTYYAISPTAVKWFGNTYWFKNICKKRLDRVVAKLHTKGVEDTPYKDKNW